jgi:hypothetical protein
VRFFIWFRFGGVEMAKALYDAEMLDDRIKKFTVRPLPAFSLARKIVIAITVVVEFCILVNLNVVFALAATTLLVALLCWWGTTGGSWNRGRRLTQFTAGPSGITFIENGAPGKVLPSADIERVYLTAPKAGEVVVFSGLGSGGSFGGVSSTGGVNATLAGRSWQVIAQVRGVEHWLGGGLTEQMASSLAVQVQRALNGR